MRNLEREHTRLQTYTHRNEELERSIRSTNYCHSLLRAERASGGWSSGLREDSCCWNDNGTYSRTNNLSFSPSHCPFSHLPPLFLTWCMCNPLLFFFFVWRLFSSPTSGRDGRWHCPHATFSPLSFISICHALRSSPGAAWRVGWRGAHRQKWGELGEEIAISTFAIMKHLDAGAAMPAH